MFLYMAVEVRISLCIQISMGCHQSFLPLLHLVGILFPHINDDARSKSHQSFIFIFNVTVDLFFQLSCFSFYNIVSEIW